MLIFHSQTYNQVITGHKGKDPTEKWKTRSVEKSQNRISSDAGNKNTKMKQLN